MNSMTRIISRALVASLLVFIAACSDSGDGVLYSSDLPSAPEASTPAPEPSPGNIVEVATAAGSFPTLLAAVEAAGLADALSDDSASLTVFAPTEAAFAALPEGTLDALLADPEALANILTYHVLDSEVGVGAALDLAPTTVATLQGGDIALTKRDDDYLYVNLSQVVDYDIEASNGVIHVIDSVLLPPDLTPSTMTIAEIAQADGNFDTLVTALTAANLVGTVNDPDASLTVFAPTDAAFEELGEAAVNYLLNNLEILESTLLYHVVAGAELTSIDAIAATGTSLVMANGDEATISLGESGLMIEGANIVTTDIVASNGIIHVIDVVLEAPSAVAAPLAVTLAADGSFSTLSGLIEEAGLADELMDPNANMTIFAPTDDAFAQMKAAGMFTKVLGKETGEHLADFTTGSFGDAVVDPETETYTFPTGAQDWAGFANNADIYPLTFEEGGSITFTASAATPTNVRFRFEFLPFPDVDPSYDTEQVLIDSTEPMEYTIEIPSQGENTFSSFLLYIVERDQPVMVSNVVVSNDTTPPPEPDAELVNLLAYHVYGDTVYSGDAIALDGNSIEMLNGEMADISVQDGNLFINDARVVTADIAAGNGVIHAINKVLSLPGGPTSVVADFTTGAFGNAVVDAETETYTFPSGAEPWAGFANNADIFPISFPEGGSITFTASAAVPTNVRFRFEYLPFPDVDPAYDTEQVLIDSTEPMEYTIEIPSQGENTFSSFLLYLVERDQAVTVSNVVVTSGVEPEPEPPANAVMADFTTGAFGNAVVDAETETYTFPSGAEGWAGFANNADIYPLTFTDGGTLTFTAAADTPTQVYFRFEYLPFPDVDPAYNTASVTINSAEPTQYSIDIPSQGENTFSSFLLYIVERDQPVMVKDVMVASAEAMEAPTNDAIADFTTGAFGNSVVDAETETYTFPSGAEGWAGFANNAEIYPLSFPEGGYVTFTASAAAATNVRFRFEFMPFPDVDPAYDTASVLVDSTEAMEYTIEVPSQGENTFSSFLLYLVERDSPVTITNVVVSSYIPAE
jgi:uncharacterized surface protein with fasciclin (FAS1) repeats